MRTDYGRGLGRESCGKDGERLFLGTFPQSPGTASPLRAAIFCGCVCESKIPKMFHLFKKVRNSCIGIIT